MSAGEPPSFTPAPSGPTQAARGDGAGLPGAPETTDDGWLLRDPLTAEDGPDLEAANARLRRVNAGLRAEIDTLAAAQRAMQGLLSATGLLVLDAQLRVRHVTPPLSDAFGISDADIGRDLADLPLPIADAASRLLRDPAPAEAEAEVQGRDGRWYMVRPRTHRLADDQTDGAVLTFVDITARRETDRVRLGNLDRYQLLFNAIDEGFCLIDVMFDASDRPFDYRFVEVNAAFERQTGLHSPVGRTIREMVPGHEVQWFEIYGRIAWSRTPERIEAPAEGLGRHFEAYGFPVSDSTPNTVGVLFRDVTDRRLADEHRDMLTHELSHRVKNTLAVVQSLARQSGSADMTVETYRGRLIGRIQALARAHDQLLDTNWQSADLRQLTEDTLAPYGKVGNRRITVAGPTVRLTPKQGLGLSLVLHELATNAAKYGSLSAAVGQLAVDWTLNPGQAGPEVNLTWTERHGPAMPQTIGQGFGTQLIQRAAGYELDGTATLHFHPQGLVAEISFPTAQTGQGQ